MRMASDKTIRFYNAKCVLRKQATIYPPQYLLNSLVKWPVDKQRAKLPDRN